ncbi:MAG: MBL fold metallo-hydrolase [Sphingomonadales bacterium]|jgi:glyoxylase-like metal-dependent hydrolase (beta-lactamase superfamily II)
MPTPTPIVLPQFDAATNTVTYLLACPRTGAAAIIDPVLDYEPKGARISHASARQLLATVRERGWQLHWLLETHPHADHLSAGDWLRSQTGARLAISRHITQVQALFAPRFGMDALPCDGRQFDVLLDDGDVLPLGDIGIKVLHTPGHTPACVTFLAGDAAFVGDTLFMPDYGTARCDFPGGSASMLWQSIQRILALPAATRLFVGHDYLPAGPAARRDFAWETTVAETRAHNIHVGGGATAAGFIAMREARDATLAKPVLILPSLQVNIAAGALPAPDARGRRFLHLPLEMGA